MEEKTDVQEAGKDLSVGETLKEVQKGHLPLGSVADILKVAPNDIITEVVDIPEWGKSMELKSFTAAASARIKSRGFAFREGETAIAWAEMEITQFMEGVKNPQWSEEDVRLLHLTSGAGFARVIAWLDEKSGIDKEALKRDRDEFQQQSKRPAV